MRAGRVRVAVDRHLAGALLERGGGRRFLALLASHCIVRRENSAPTLTSHTLAVHGGS